jgi:polyferredoxin/formate hydrogenlyase subunit 6/NADH:ubiquinone oxidoreductase subunit I
MRTARRVSQILFLLLFLLFWIRASYPLQTAFPVDGFLRLSPLGTFTAAIASRSWISACFWALALAAAGIVFGRFFCGWVCPMGTLIDGFDNRTKPSRKRRPDHGADASMGRLRSVKYFTLAALFTAALFSVQLAGWFDPISILTRTLTAVLFPLFVWITDGLIAFLSGIPFLESAVGRMDDWLHVSILPVTSSDFQGAFWIGFIFLAILMLGLIRSRFWCRYLCPLGALFGVLSRFRWYRRTVGDQCRACGLCAVRCRMDAIPPDYVSTRHTECINCMDCQTDCPDRVVRFSFVRKPSSAPVDLSRRKLLGAGLTGLFAAGLAHTRFTDPVRSGLVIRPPAARTEDQFLDRCIRCGECVRICSTSGKGLQLAGLETGWDGMGTPVLSPPKGYCEYQCNLCGQVCPTGAIPRLTMEEKQSIKMGTAHFDKTRCIPWYYGENCMVCEEHCPVPEKAIRFREATVWTIDGHKNTVLQPYVVEDTCVGCGICAVRCPVEGLKGIYLTNAGERRT